MKLLIAGGAGYVGSVLIPKLLDRGYKVDVVDLFWFGNHLPHQVTVLHKDIFQLSIEDLKSYDQVIFLAGLSNDPMAEYSPTKNFIFNAAAPSYLAYVSKRAGVRRYIYACSCSVYGYTVNELYDETRPVASSYPYGISKLQGEQAALHMVDANFSVISLRKGTISGAISTAADCITVSMILRLFASRVVPVSVTSIMQSEFSGGLASVAPNERKIFALGLSPFLHHGVTIIGSASPKRFLYDGLLLIYSEAMFRYSVDTRKFLPLLQIFSIISDHAADFTQSFWHSYD